jgi:hypothetical protein
MQRQGLQLVQSPELRLLINSTVHLSNIQCAARVCWWLLQNASQYQLDLAASQPPPASQPAPSGDGEDEDDKDSLQVTSMILHACLTWKRHRYQTIRTQSAVSFRLISAVSSQPSISSWQCSISDDETDCGVTTGHSRPQQVEHQCRLSTSAFAGNKLRHLSSACSMTAGAHRRED